MPEAREPLIFIVSGPSGSGKSTLVKKLLELPNMMLSISATTRPPRESERPDEWYQFVSPEEFQRMIEAGEFLEYACVFGKHSYGTPKRWLEVARATGRNLVLEIDVQGAEQVKHKVPGAVSIFVYASKEDLERRLRARGENSEEDIKRRLERAKEEVEKRGNYDYVVKNDNIERAGREVQDIARAALGRSARNERRLKEILESFGG
jgi:guanylate kinase